MADDKGHKGGKQDFGASKKTDKGAHGGGNPYHDMKLKYPKFALGEGFKQKDKPGKSTGGNSIPEK